MEQNLLVKLYYICYIQKCGLEHLAKHLHESGNDALLQNNTEYIRSLMSEQQLSMWPLWVKDVVSKDVAGYIDYLEKNLGILSDIPSSTHLEEYTPETKTVLLC